MKMINMKEKKILKFKRYRKKRSIIGSLVCSRVKVYA